MALNKRKALKELVRELEKNYLLQRACNKLGLARSTVYRWMQEDQEFAAAIHRAQAIGRRYMSDFVESKLLKNVENQEQRAIEFWLKSNNEHYRSHNTALDRQVDRLQRELRESRAALAMVGKESLFKDFIDWRKVGEYLQSPEREKIREALEGINTGASAYDSKNLQQVRKILAEIQLAEHLADASNVPEEYVDLVD